MFVLGVHRRPNISPPYALDPAGGDRLVVFAPKPALTGTAALIPDQAKVAEDGELRRLVYVAVTRAVHLCVLYCGAKAAGPLAELLYGSARPPSAGGPPARVMARTATAGGVLRSATYLPSTPVRRWVPGDGAGPSTLEIATLDRSFDRTARRWSFTRISGLRVQPRDHVEEGASILLQESQPDPGAADEATPDGLTVDESDVEGSTLPLGDLPGGSAFGTMVHRVLERVDFAAPDLAVELDHHVGDAVGWSNWTTEREPLVAGLAAVLDTPLGPLFDERPLRSFRPAERLDELTFEIPLAPGMPVEARPTPGAIGRLVLEHLVPSDPLRPWAAELADGAIATRLGGHLTGSIDGVLRVDSGDQRFVVVDYKTNRLGTLGVPLTAADYRPQALVDAMVHHDYPLQALLYLVALHRYLRWRLGAGYRPDAHLGGAVYLFVRGMTGPGTPRFDGYPAGVFSWAVPPALVSDLSNLLHGRGS